VIKINILIITGTQSFSAAQKIAEETTTHNIKVIEATISVSAFLSEELVNVLLSRENLKKIDIVLLPGFIQWNTRKLEEKFSIPIRKGPRFLSDLPAILCQLDDLVLSNIIPACELLKSSGEDQYREMVKNRIEKARKSISTHTFIINEKFPDKIVGRNLPPLIIAEIINAPEKSFEQLDRKINHYIDSGADIIDLGCVSNKPNPSRLKEIIEYIKSKYDILLSADSLNSDEINAAIDSGIDVILSLDYGNYKNHIDAPRDLPFVILPTDTTKAIMPKTPESRIERLFELSRRLKNKGFQKLILDPLLETPINPGFLRSLNAYSLYKRKSKEEEYNDLEFPLFFGISNVVELMDIDSIGINGLLACIAAELDIGVVFTVEHSVKLFNGIKELKEGIKLAYLSKYKTMPPINQGIQVFRAKSKKKIELPPINRTNAYIIEELDEHYISDPKGYCKIYINQYSSEIYLLHFSNDHSLLNTIIGKNAEDISKKIIKLKLTEDMFHINYLGRELKKAEICLKSGKYYIQDE
jgi:dihydropteroate synthase-like protein